MPDYQRMYSLLFNAVTDALEELKLGRILTAETLLRKAQQDTETIYMDADML